MPPTTEPSHRWARRIRAVTAALPAVFSVRVRAILSLGMVLALGCVGTFALWSNSAGATSGAISTGTVDLRVGDVESFEFTSLASSNLLPGESRASALQVQNTRSTMAVTYTMTAATPAGSPALAGHLRIQVFSGGTASNSTTGGIRTGSCTGTQIGSGTMISGASVGLITAARPLAAASGTETLCFVATLPSSAPIATQNQSVSAIVLTFNAQTTV